MHPKGFSLIELLVAVAILGIIAAMGAVAFTGYIKGAIEKEATTGLSSIYLAQEEYRSLHGSYYQSAANCTASSNHSSIINTNLFNGDVSLDQTNDRNFNFCIEWLGGSSSTFQANAYYTDNSADYFTITNANLKRKFESNSWTEGW
tara:strand:+ start:62 stop:502 length:441 start_codon:yes stop_codon:yes gene_type:complete